MQARSAPPLLGGTPGRALSAQQQLLGGDGGQGDGTLALAFSGPPRGRGWWSVSLASTDPCPAPSLRVRKGEPRPGGVGGAGGRRSFLFSLWES